MPLTTFDEPTLTRGFISCLYLESEKMNPAILQTLLEEEFAEKFIYAEGPIDTMFDHYSKEMCIAGQGPETFRRCFFFSLSSQFPRQDLWLWKIKSWEIEHRYRIKSSLNDGPEITGRSLNLDPGYIALEQVVMATFRPQAHRLVLSPPITYLRPEKNDQRPTIYLDLVYIYKQREFHSLPWTYYDYQSPQLRDLFKSYRPNVKQ